MNTSLYEFDIAIDKKYITVKNKIVAIPNAIV